MLTGKLIYRFTDFITLLAEKHTIVLTEIHTFDA